MIEAAKFILRKDTDDFKQARVAVTAPTAVAAKIVGGRTIDSAFQTFNPNRYGVDLMEPSRKGNFDDEWKNLGKLLLILGWWWCPPPPEQQTLVLKIEHSSISRSLKQQLGPPPPELYSSDLVQGHFALYHDP